MIVAQRATAIVQTSSTRKDLAPRRAEVGQAIDFEKARTGHGISDLSYYGLFRSSLLQ
jgi:hypothetical protein